MEKSEKTTEEKQYQIPEPTDMELQQEAWLQEALDQNTALQNALVQEQKLRRETEAARAKLATEYRQMMAAVAIAHGGEYVVDNIVFADIQKDDALQLSITRDSNKNIYVRTFVPDEVKDECK